MKAIHPTSKGTSIQGFLAELSVSSITKHNKLNHMQEFKDFTLMQKLFGRRYFGIAIIVFAFFLIKWAYSS